LEQGSSALRQAGGIKQALPWGVLPQIPEQQSAGSLQLPSSVPQAEVPPAGALPPMA
jgi:hypothetical protein